MEASVRVLGLTARRTTSTSTPLLRRTFTTSPLRQQDEQFPSTSPSSRSTVTPSISSLLDDSLDLNKGQHASRQSRFPSRYPPSQNSGASLSNFAAQMTATARSSSKQTTRSSNSSGALDIDSLFNSPSAGPPSGITPESELPQVKLDPTVGRTVRVDMNRGMDVGKAFRTLEMQCSRNRVRADFNRQRFHERPGLKRKRLKSERWKRNFKAAFKETVGMVVRMKGQGW